MPPTDDPRGSARSAAEVNEQIRSLWLRAGGRLSSEQRREYELLVTEWAVAMREEIVKAA
ncbi:hypothetical protein HUT18_02200 [Streptomyces sp. NA04227]|uniref:hypothetical protein n=1 Tax=Streptomyces sp. NA04227 TaxID=2742136 RepID=UPI00158FE090|nr:hypothetical protein [Streptomyces sp. NA04227]QKW05362.1 hypothetical protein HUT18_02200 [Streptomyces sp. NA04227]